MQIHFIHRMFTVKVPLLQSAIFLVAWIIVEGLRNDLFLHKKVSILSDEEETEGPKMAAQQAANENCVCVFHYLCDRNYNLITNGGGIIDERIGPSDPLPPPQTQCPTAGQVCCRVPNGTVVPSTLPPQVSSGAPATAAPPTTLSPPPGTTPPRTTPGGATPAGTTPRQGGDNPSITLPPGTVIILPTSPPPVATTAAPVTTPPGTTRPPGSTVPPGTTAAAGTTAAPATTPTPRPQTVPTGPPPTGPPLTTGAPPTTPGGATTPSTTRATAPGNTTAVTTAAPGTTAARTTTAGNVTPPLVLPTLPPPLTPTPPPQTIPTVPPSTGSPRPTSPTVPPSTGSPTPTRPPLPTTPPIVFPGNNTTSIPATSQPPVVFPTTPGTGTGTGGTTAPPVVFPTTPGGATPAPGTTASPATSGTTARPATTTPGTPGSQCGVRYIQPGRVEAIEPYATSFGEFPWMLAVLDSTALTVDGTVVRNAFVAGASLITRNIALTGAHRLKNFINRPSSLIVRAGEWNTVTANEPLPHQDRTVQSIEIHNDFNNVTLFNDIALLKLEEPVVFANNVVPICLPSMDQQFSGSCVATGWGQNAFGPNGSYQRIMRKVTLPLVDRATCQRQLRSTRLGFGFVLDSGFMCAGGQPNLDTCTGDGGGPLVCATPTGYVQAGVVSWGIGCGMANVPGVYINVAYFREWINSSMRKLSMDTVPRFSANKK